MRRQSAVTAGSIFGLLALSMGTWAKVVPTPKCYPEETTCTLTAGGCIAAPTSLRPLSDTISSDGDGWVKGTKCGKDRTGSNCGKYLGKSVCIDGTGCDCGGGMGPCTEALPEGGEEGIKELFSETRPKASEAPETPLLRQRLQAIAKAGLLSELYSFAKGIAALDSLHIQAEVEIWRVDTSTKGRREIWGAASFEQWEAGERYRFSAPVPTDLGMSQFADIAFDGRRYQMYLRDSTLVTVGTADSRIYMAPLRSPLALAALYLTPTDDKTCPLCELRLSDLKSIASSLSRSEQGSEGTVLRTPAARWGAESVDGYRLQYKAAHRGVESTLEQVTSKGQVLSRVRLTNFNPVPGHPDLLFPWTIVYEILDSRGRRPIVRQTYRIGLLEADKEIPDSVFRLSIQGGRHVWDEERNVHLQ